MLDEAPERGGLEFGSGLVVERHGYRPSLGGGGLGTSLPLQ
jgi:hypothetical protein